MLLHKLEFGVTVSCLLKPYLGMIFEEVDFRELICMVKHVLRAVSMVMFTIKVVAIKRLVAPARAC